MMFRETANIFTHKGSLGKHPTFLETDMFSQATIKASAGARETELVNHLLYA